MSETSTRITGVRTVSVPVTDQDRALEFYRDTLGLETRMDATFGGGQRWIELAAPGAPTTIALAQPAPGEPVGIDTGIRLLTTDAEADYDALKAGGAVIEGELMRWPNVPAMFMLRDPDGNLLRVIEDEVESGSSQEAAGRKRFVVLVKSDARTESGAMPDERSLSDMTRFNEELVDSGHMLAGEGLHPSSNGARISFSGGAPAVTRGPFGEPYQLVAGYWMIQAESLDEAIDLMSRAPMGEGVAEIEIRQVFDDEDFGEAFTPELREREERQRVKMEHNARRRAA